jgi:hypothetical protein
MTRDEEKRVDDLPEERGTMSAREALARAYVAHIHWPDLLPSIRDVLMEEADNHIAELKRLGFAVLPSIPSPR